ncbi:UDP-N-acetylglucosamine 2-epimerase [Pseudoalteromonas lipolytica SCSIO 04301]|uniref:UDP-N-acetylglucosamine 2-epimerase n=1 Tax=Pseudoalteromonas lipolytica TaxID=570156 RepID=UPI000447891B|nr:UDP-N-acetylglucosamine 2-epimerase [Pseudoalteromonas lipolytica]EWH06142.1 UDP-N-acetylglucosamine 2-epimerase [Pseudoalteromonas lipolytica SCSIO 04301]
MKKILFLTGTRADFGKLKSLICKVEQSDSYEAHLFVTGMHMLSKYGMTVKEVEKSQFRFIYKYINQNISDSMDIILAKTIQGLSDYSKELKPDMIVVHGDRVEALAGAIVGSLNNILVAHIEGGEVSGAIDELIRHSVSKMSHLHFVSNSLAEKRLIQLGERKNSIFIIGSPDLDIMSSSNLPSIDTAKARYDINFDNYAVFMYHPITTDLGCLKDNIRHSIDAMIESQKNYIVIYPNNDDGSEIIISELDKLKSHKRFRVFPSLRFEHFLTLLKNAQFMLGNSSAGVREMPFYGLPSINIGNRQENRAKACSIINCEDDKLSILKAITSITDKNFKPSEEFGSGKSDELFYEVLSIPSVWETPKQKIFVPIL